MLPLTRTALRRCCCCCYSSRRNSRIVFVVALAVDGNTSSNVVLGPGGSTRAVAAVVLVTDGERRRQASPLARIEFGGRGGSCWQLRLLLLLPSSLEKGPVVSRPSHAPRAGPRRRLFAARSAAARCYCSACKPCSSSARWLFGSAQPATTTTRPVCLSAWMFDRPSAFLPVSTHSARQLSAVAAAAGGEALLVAQISRQKQLLDRQTRKKAERSKATEGNESRPGYSMRQRAQRNIAATHRRTDDQPAGRLA